MTWVALGQYVTVLASEPFRIHRSKGPYSKRYLLATSYVREHHCCSAGYTIYNLSTVIAGEHFSAIYFSVFASVVYSLVLQTIQLSWHLPVDVACLSRASMVLRVRFCSSFSLLLLLKVRLYRTGIATEQLVGTYESWSYT